MRRNLLLLLTSRQVPHLHVATGPYCLFFVGIPHQFSTMAEVEEPIVDMPEEVEETEEVEVEEEEDFVQVGGAAEIKLFGKWSFDDIEVRDISLVVRI